MRRSMFLIGFMPILAFANTVTFVTPTGSMANGGPVSDQAAFTTTAGSLVVTLQDLQANPTDVGQLLSDLSFTVSNGSLTGSSLLSSSGGEITVNSSGTFTLGSTVPTGWAEFLDSDTVAELGVLGTAIAPAHLIIGPSGSGNIYSNANGSIAGNGPHNPFLNQTATFTITGTGITAATSITGATFSFGTTFGVDVVGVPSGAPIPEPRTTGFMITALGLIGILQYRRKKAQSAV